MALYAHAVIDAPNGKRYERGDEIDESDFVVKDDDTDHVAELLDGGSLSEEDYDPAADEVPAPDVVEIDGVRYVKTTDASKEKTDADRS
jgi:hypothetical protein